MVPAVNFSGVYSPWFVFIWVEGSTVLLLSLKAITCSVLMLHINHTRNIEQYRVRYTLIKKQCCNSPEVIIDEPQKINGTCTTFQVWFWSAAAVAHVDHKDSHVSRFDEDPPHTHRMFSAMNNVEDEPAEWLWFNGDIICLCEKIWNQILPKALRAIPEKSLDSLIIFRKQIMFCALHLLFVSPSFSPGRRDAREKAPKWPATWPVARVCGPDGGQLLFHADLLLMEIPAKIDTEFIPLFARFYISQVVQDFFHQQHDTTPLFRSINIILYQ